MWYVSLYSAVALLPPQANRVWGPSHRSPVHCTQQLCFHRGIHCKYVYAVSSWKYVCTPVLHATFRQKWGVCSSIQLVSCIHPPPHLVPCDVYVEGRQSQQLLWLSGRTAASLNMYYGKSAAFVLILSWESPPMEIGDDISMYSQQWNLDSSQQTRL